MSVYPSVITMLESCYIKMISYVTVSLYITFPGIENFSTAKIHMFAAPLKFQTLENCHTFYQLSVSEK